MPFQRKTDQIRFGDSTKLNMVVPSDFAFVQFSLRILIACMDIQSNMQYFAQYGAEILSIFLSFFYSFVSPTFQLPILFIILISKHFVNNS